MKSEAAQVANLIKTELKKNGINCRVKSSNYAGGNSVRVYVANELPGSINKITAFCSKFQQGTFDGMTDCYISTNYRTDIPQVKFVFVDNEFSPQIKQSAWEFIRRYYALPDVPDNYDDIHNTWLANFQMYATTLVYRELANESAFWAQHKPSVLAA